MTVSNTLSSVIPLIYAKGLMALRHNAVMPRLVMNDFSREVSQKGATVQIPLPSPITTQAVVPAAYAPDPGNLAPTTATIALNQWYEAPFALSEQEVANIVEDVIPMQLTAAVEALAAQVNLSILNLYKTVGNAIGTPATTPFQSNDVTPATNAGAILTRNLAPASDRHIVLDPTSYGTVLAQPNFFAALNVGTTESVREGRVTRRFGFDWAEDQSITAATAGTLTGTVTANGAQAAGVTTVSIATAASSTFVPVAGDIILFSGDAQTYAVQSGTGLAASSNGNFVIFPAKVVALAGGETVSIKGAAVNNLAFHRQAFAFASRPLVKDNLTRPADMEMMVPDPVSGITMRLTVREEFHRTRFSYDILWGVAPVRPQLACRIFG